MLRIIGLQKSEDPNSEFVLLQNQGHMRVTLKGHAIVGESAIQSCGNDPALHMFPEEVSIPAGMFIMLISGEGESGWAKTKDGSHVFHTYMGRHRGVWVNALCPLHVMTTCHSYLSRVEASALRVAVI